MAAEGACGTELAAIRTLMEAVRSGSLLDDSQNFQLTRDAYMGLGEPRPDLWLFGIEPEVAEGMGDRVTYHRYPRDESVNELLNTCS